MELPTLLAPMTGERRWNWIARILGLAYVCALPFALIDGSAEIPGGGRDASPVHPLISELLPFGVGYAWYRVTRRWWSGLAAAGALLFMEAIWTRRAFREDGVLTALVFAPEWQGTNPCLDSCLVELASSPGLPFTLLLSIVALWPAARWRSVVGTPVLLYGLELWRHARTAVYTNGAWSVAPIEAHLAGAVLMTVGTIVLAWRIALPWGLAAAALFPRFDVTPLGPLALPVSWFDSSYKWPLTLLLLAVGLYMAWRCQHACRAASDRA